MPIPGYIYALVEREFVRTGENVVKVGRSLDILDRVRGYPKGSVLLFCCYAHDAVGTETQLLALMAVAFKRRADIGREYFEGDLRDALALVTAFLLAQLKDAVSPQLMKRAVEEAEREAQAETAAAARLAEEAARLAEVAAAEATETRGW